MQAVLQDADPVLTRARVRLDLFRPAQITADYLRWINDPDIMRYTEARFDRHTEDSARAYVADSNATDRSRLFRILFDGRHVGNLRVSAIDWRHRRAEIAIIIGERDVHGRGVGSTAVDLASEWCFAALGLRKLAAGMYSDNQASIRAFAKVGYRIEGTLAGHFLCEGKPMDAVLMARFNPDDAGR